MDETILRVENLRKKYGGKYAIKNISMEASAGRIVGLMGPNGSGKTTFMKVVAGLSRANGGTVEVCGRKIGVESKKLVSFLPDRNIMPRWMTACDAIDCYGDFFDDFDKAKARDTLAFMNLKGDVPVSQMSKGMIEKLNLTLCFSRKAKLYLLDEPLGGVDPVARERIVGAVAKTYSADSCIVISTHLVHDIESMFNDVRFIDDGEIILAGGADDLRAERGMDIDGIYRQIFRAKE